MQLPYDSASAFLGISLREVKAYVYTNICTSMFIEFLFLIVQNWKYVCCPVGEWLNKLWYIHSGLLLSLERNKVLIYEYATWMNLLRIRLRGKKGQSPKVTCSMILKMTQSWK